MASRVSVCLLTRDEQRNIERAIRSVLPVADELIVADTGSTDQTVDIARSLGARVVACPWDDDFSEGRNFALAQASGDWILWLNPDEELRAEPDLVRSLVESPAATFGFLARIQSIPRPDRPDEFTETWDLRLYRRRDDLRYVGRLHPGFAAELVRAVTEQGQQVYPSDVAIRRHAYSSTLDESKLRWAVRLLEKELRDRPGRLHYLIEYGRNLLMLRDPKGHQVMAEAIEQVLPDVAAPAAPSPDVQVLLEYVINTPPGSYRGGLSLMQAVDLALRWFPDSPPLLWSMAQSYFRTRQFRPASVLLERLVYLGAARTYDRTQGFDPRVVGPAALLNLGQCYRALGQTDDAGRCLLPLLQDGDYASQAASALAEMGHKVPGPEASSQRAAGGSS